MKVAKHLRIEGRVQGVGYRYEMQAQGKQLGLSGWVRNRYDDSVEAVVCGNMNEVNQIISWARRGPRLANVTRVVVSETEIPYREDFVILPKE